MAHAVSGSAYSAKGGNLKFADVVRERFRGPAFGQDFTTWLDEVLLGFETANISESSQVTQQRLYSVHLDCEVGVVGGDLLPHLVERDADELLDIVDILDM